MYILQLSNSTWLWVSFWSGVVLFWIQHLPCLDSFRCMLWKYCGVFTKDHIISSLRINLILACQEVLKWVWPKMNWTTLFFFIQIYTLPPSMHKWKENIDVRVILRINRIFGQELVVLHTILYMFGKLSVHAWSRCGGLNEEHTILVHGGKFHFSTSSHVKMSWPSMNQ